MASRRPPINQDNRRSGVSSFYGARSDDDPHGDGYNSREMEYNPRPSVAQSAGYSYDSYSKQPEAIEPVKGGQDEGSQGPGWDIYADFNNAGPRYSSAFPMNMGLKPDTGYRPLSRAAESAPARSKKGGGSTTYEPEVELVTVPALGAEWSAQELKDMKKSGKAELKAEERRRAWNLWKRDQRGMCGISWLTRRFIVWTSFFTFIIVGLLLFFCIPRAPVLSFNENNPVTNNGGPDPYFNRFPANFSFTGNVNLQADTHSTYLPLHFSNITADMYAAETSKLVASGSTGPFKMSAKQYISFPINMTFAYDAVNSSDVTWNMYYNACKNSASIANGTRPGLNIRLVIQMHIDGLIGERGASTMLNNVECPIELPLNAG